jgi:hypothetical protein
MTNLVPANISVPAHLANRRAAVSLTETVSGGLTVGATFPKISIRASRFRIVKEGTEHVLDDLKLPTVIVGGNPRVSKAYYINDYDGNAEAKAPDCMSPDGVRPTAESAKPQAELCATCPQNAWGSKIGKQGQKLKACNDKKRLAVAASADPAGDIYLLEVTPSAFKDFAAYVKSLQMRGIHLETVSTIVSFDSSASFPKLTFSFGGFLSEDAQGIVDQRLEADIDLIHEITGEAVAAVALPPAAPAPASKPVLVRAAEPAPAPAATGGFGVPAAAPTGFGSPAAAPSTPPKAFGSTPAPAKAPPIEEPVAGKSSALTDEISALLAGLGDDD